MIYSRLQGTMAMWKAALGTAALALTLSYGWAAPTEYIRNIARGMGEAGVLRAQARGPEVYGPSILLKVGGVLFQGTVSDDAFYKALTSIELVREGAAARLKVTAGTQGPFSYEAPFWIFTPTIAYAANENNGAISLFDEPTEVELKKLSPSVLEYDDKVQKYNSAVTSFNELLASAAACQVKAEPSTECFTLNNSLLNLQKSLSSLETEIEVLKKSALAEVAEFSSAYFFAAVHENLRGTAVGLRLLQVDSLPIDASYLEEISVNNHAAAFPGEPGGTFDAKDRETLNIAVLSAMTACTAESGRSVTAWILTDVETEYRVQIKNGNLAIAGSPYYYMWDKDSEGTPTGVASCTNAFKDLRSTFAELSPRTWGTALHVARLSAFVRGLSVARPDLAQKLTEDSARLHLTLPFSTPRVWPRDGYSDF
jgi:hypothetical protein